MRVDTAYVTADEQKYIDSILQDGVYPTLEQVWALVDAAWNECQCDQGVTDERVSKFYAHPVWLLNGLFVEQHAESLKQRQNIAEYVANLRPKRVADFGGGFGSLARMIGGLCPTAEINVVEPHPHRMAVYLAEKTSNVRYRSDLIGEYDVLIATDVFEHVQNPLALVESTSAHLKVGGEYIIANCFWPVVSCHLPSTYHFRWSWHLAMEAMNLYPGKSVSYGRSYKKLGHISADSAHSIELRSKRWFWLIETMPYRYRERVAHFLIPER